jgi:lipopolysaccharide transport system ATP-binding protein
MIHVNHLSKRFLIYDRPLNRLRDWLLPIGRRSAREFWALRDVNFDVEPGASVGIVGVNGAGKSTLLKILTGTIAPTGGTFKVEGRVASLLELGTGFHPEFTGRQNILFNGRMAGLTDDELHARFADILDFAELGDFIDQPVRTYSSGMVLRLGFALASSVDPDVLIIDEALSVGDLHFQQKCLKRIRDIHGRGTTVLFVSHDPGLIQKFCTEALLLDAGAVIERGKPAHVLDYYTALLAEKYREGGAKARIIKPRGAADTPPPPEVDSAASPALQPAGETPPPLVPRGHRTGNFRAVITSVYLRALGMGGNSQLLVTGTPASLCVRCVALAEIPELTVGIMLKDRLGQEVFGVNTAYRDEPIGPLRAGEAAQIEFSMPMNLGEGLYSVTAALHAGDNHTEACYDWVEQALEFQILPNPLERFTGLVRMELELHVRTGQASAEDLARAQALAPAPAG